MLVCLTCLQVHRFMIKAVFQVFTTFRGRSSSFVVHSFVLDLNHSDQRNNFCPQKVKYSCLQIWWLRWGMNIRISWSDLPHLFKSCPNPSSISDSLQSDLLSYPVYFGLKLLDLSRSELFRPFVLFFTVNLSAFTLIWNFYDLICRSPWCFGFL